MKPRLIELLRTIARAMERSNLDYAIGGAVAMAAYGYERNTTDIDLFVNREQRPQVLRLLRGLGLGVTSVHSGLHYVGAIPRISIERLHVDVLFPESDPDWSAVQLPETVKLDGVRFEAFPLPLLFLAKAQAVIDGGDYERKHEADLRHLLNEGFVEEKELLVFAKRMKMQPETRRLLRRLKNT